MLSTGMVHLGQGTGFAKDYSYFPGLEIIVSVLSMISLIPQVALLKYAGSLLSIVTVMFLLFFYSRVLGRQADGLAERLWLR